MTEDYYFHLDDGFVGAFFGCSSVISGDACKFIMFGE